MIYREEHLLSKPNLLTDNDDDNNYYNSGGGRSAINIVYFPSGYWIIKKNTSGVIIDVFKVITDPLIEAKYNDG
jgi:hypothetical protein